MANLKNNFKWDGIMKKEKWNGKWLDLNKENCKWHYYSKYNAANHPKFKEVT